MSSVLIACEESQVVTAAFRNIGIEAFSCDIVPTSRKEKGWHLRGDVTPLLQLPWDMIIAFPPCTHLANSGARWFNQKIENGQQQQGIDFFMLFTVVECAKVAIENPVGIMSTVWRKPDQIIQPYQFGDAYSKKTCLWLKGLPKLKPTKVTDKGEFVTFSSGKKMPKWYSDAFRCNPQERAKIRSRTFDGIAQAMAKQWGALLYD